MVGIPRPPNFYRGDSTVDSSSIVDGSVASADVSTTLVYDMDNKAAVVGADRVLIADSEASNVNKEATITAVMELAAGTVATSSIENASGVLKVDIKNTTATTEPAAADFVLTSIAATGVNKASTITNLAKATGQIFAGTNATSALAETDGVGLVSLSGVTPKTAPVGADGLLINDSENSNVNKLSTITNLAETLAGTVANSGIENTSGVLSIVPASLTAATPAGGDSVIIADANGTPAGVARSCTLTNLMEVVAGTVASTGIENTTGVLSVVPNSVTAKNIPVGADVVLIADSADTYANKKSTITEIAETMAGTVTDSGIENAAGVLSVVPASLTAATPVGGDALLFADADGTPANVARKVTLTNLMEVVAGTVTDTAIENTTGVLSVAPADDTLAVATDSIVFSTAAGVTKKDLVSDVVTAVAGTLANSGLKATSGVLGVDITDLTAADVNVGEDMFVFSDEGTAGDPIRRESFADLATAMAGTGLLAASGVIATEDPGAIAIGSIYFGATGDCTSITIGAVTYPYDAAPEVTDGEWAYGASASDSATNLAAAINGKTDSPYTATVNTDTVHVYAEAVGTAGNVTITRTGGAQPATVENLVGGLAAATKQQCTRVHTVTANDVDTAVLVNIPLPFVPTRFMAEVRSATGLQKIVTDLFTIAATPNRIVLTGDGATHVVATDVITVTAYE